MFNSNCTAFLLIIIWWAIIYHSQTMIALKWLFRLSWLATVATVAYLAWLEQQRPSLGQHWQDGHWVQQQCHLVRFVNPPEGFPNCDYWHSHGRQRCIAAMKAGVHSLVRCSANDNRTQEYVWHWWDDFSRSTVQAYYNAQERKALNWFQFTDQEQRLWRDYVNRKLKGYAILIILMLFINIPYALEKLHQKTHAHDYRKAQ